MKHQAAHNSWRENLPSVVGIENFLPSVIVHGGYVLLPAKIEYRHVLLLTSVGGEYSLLTVPIHGGYAQSPAKVAGECIRPFASAGCSTFCL